MKWILGVWRRSFEKLGLEPRQAFAVLFFAWGAFLVRSSFESSRWYGSAQAEFFWGVLLLVGAGVVLLKTLIALMTRSNEEKGRALMVALLPLVLVIGAGLGAAPGIGYAKQIAGTLDEVRDEVATVVSAAEEVQSNAERFASENWRRVVPDLDSAVQDLVEAVEQLRSVVE